MVGTGTVKLDIPPLPASMGEASVVVGVMDRQIGIRPSALRKTYANLSSPS